MRHRPTDTIAFARFVMALAVLVFGSFGTSLAAARVDSDKPVMAKPLPAESYQVAQSGTGTIRLRKQLQPSNDPGRFHLKIVDASGNVVGLLQNAGHGGTLGFITVPAGIYYISEAPGFATVGTDYTTNITGAGCASGTVNVLAGHHYTCIFKNKKKPKGRITVKKVTVPAMDAGLFTLQISNSSNQLVANALSVHAPATLGPVQLTSGSVYTISEIAGNGTNLSNYSQTITGAGCAGGVVNLVSGANIVCTITNTRNATGQISVKKITVPANDPGHFTLQITNSNTGQVVGNLFNATAPAQLGPINLPSGIVYNVGEMAGSATNLTDYTQTISGAGCTGGAVNLTANAEIHCTITNTRINTTCTGWPLQANVDIHYAGIPGPQQTVHICRGGTVTFINHVSTPNLITFVSGPTPFAALTTMVAGTAITPVLPSIGTESYKVTGTTLPTALTAQIVVH